jgi:2-amino-4-hydroxy-6-hydroxymethyldihydropteridine diphosphokinase
MSKSDSAWIGLGSNLDNPEQQLRRALAELDDLPQTRVLQASRLYRSPPMGPADQPDYINAVAQIETGLEPQVLLEALQGIEQAHERRRERRWGPRTLDLDILLYDERQIDTPSLQVPHPGLHERAFVLYPLYELDPGLEIPGRGSLETLVGQVDANGLVAVEQV